MLSSLAARLQWTISTFVASLALLLALAGQVSAAPPSPSEELLVGFQGGVTEGDADEVLKGHGAVKVEKVRNLNVHRVRVPPQALEAIERALAKRKEVKFVERNQALRFETVPNDPSYATQWHHAKIGAPQAWDVTQGRPEIIIAIVDTGVDPTHPDLVGNLVAGYNFYDNNTNTADVVGHGTLVAGAAGAVGNNAVGVAGVAWRSKIMPLRVSDLTGLTYQSTVATAITWAADHGAKVVNLSIGGVAASATTTAAAQYARSRGVFVVAGSGNCSCVDPTPENAYILSVGNTDKNDAVYTSSSRGNYVDLSAPGVLIYSTARGGGYAYGTGTSIASPIVAGVVALMLSANPELKPAEVEALLEANADDLGPAGWDSGYGWGRVNAARAVSAAKASVPPPDTTAPTVAIATPTGGSTLSSAANVGVTAADNASVTAVDLYVNGNYYASDTAAPYSFFLDTTSLANGSHALQARATDGAGNAGSSATVTVNVSNVVDTTPPTVAVTSVAKLVKGSNTTLNVNVSATDNVGVSKVELYVDGARVSTLSAPPYGFALNIRSYAAGTHSLQAKAYDAQGNVGASAPTSFTK